MTPERHAQVKAIFQAAASAAPREREAVIRARCGDDPELVREVERLFQFYTAASTTQTAGPQAPSQPQDSVADSTVDLQRQGDQPREIAPGTMLAGRYRIVSRLGRGGMGIVYKAEDMVLQQTVAVKFLNPLMARAPAWLQRFKNEVRLARTVTHPNLCRVYDIGEADGVVYFTMECIDGDDLKSLITQIGRLPVEKAIDAARQLCVGVAAAHGAGILHRDLKPANVMLDSKGRIRITDFGLAALPETLKKTDIPAGTPAYMSPEQVAGKEVTVRSDIYSLGLVLYEMFAGVPALPPPALRTASGPSLPTPPNLSEIVPEIPANTARIIHRCLSIDPADRPACVVEIAAALPGGDILNAALAANLVPTPEMVVSARARPLQPAGAVAVLACGLAALASICVLKPRTRLMGDLAETKPPLVLLERARELLKSQGIEPQRSHFAYGFADDQELQAAACHLGGCDAFAPEDSIAGIGDEFFWYREAAGALAPSHIDNVLFGPSQVTLSDPPPDNEGARIVILDRQGRLRMFAEPGVVGRTSTTKDAADSMVGASDALLRAAGVSPIGDSVPTTADPMRPDAKILRVRNIDSGQEALVETIAENNSLKLFRVAKTKGSEASPTTNWITDVGRRRATITAWMRFMFFLTTVFVLPWAVWNAARGLGDFHGAIRVGASCAVLIMMSWILGATHAPSIELELRQFCAAVVRSIGGGAFVGIQYLGLEPYARRRWPHMLVTWTRLISSHMRNAAVGQHILLGAALGCYFSLLGTGERFLVEQLGWDARERVDLGQISLKIMGARLAMASYLDAIPDAVFRGLLLLFLLASLRVLLRKPALAATAAALLVMPLVVPRGANWMTSTLILGIGGGGVAVWVMARFGLLPLVVALFVAPTLTATPVAFDASVWYSGITVFSFLLVIGLMAAGLLISRSSGPVTDSQLGLLTAQSSQL